MKRIMMIALLMVMVPAYAMENNGARRQQSRSTLEEEVQQAAGEAGKQQKKEEGWGFFAFFQNEKGEWDWLSPFKDDDGDFPCIDDTKAKAHRLWCWLTGKEEAPSTRPVPPTVEQPVPPTAEFPVPPTTQFPVPPTRQQPVPPTAQYPVPPTAIDQENVLDMSDLGKEDQRRIRMLAEIFREGQRKKNASKSEGIAV